MFSRSSACRFGGLLTLLLGTAAYAQSSTSYFIQAGAYDSPQEAAEVQAALLRTCAPVTVQVRDGAKPYKVCVGEFSSYLDAWSNKQKLKKGFPTDAFITSGTASAVPAANSLPVEKPFAEIPLADNGTSAGEYWQAGGFGADPEPEPVLTEASPSILNRSELLQVGLSAAKHPFTGVKPLEEFLRRFSDDPAADGARLRLARVYGRGSNPARAEVLLNQVLKNGNPVNRAMARFISAHVKLNRQEKGAAYEAFRALANDSTLPAELRRESMRRAAAIAHSQQDYANSWLAYKHIAATADSKNTEAESNVQLAGLMFEMVKRSKGTWPEVRQLCRKVADDPQVSHASRATAELMFLETYYEEHDYEKARTLAGAYLASYGDVARESNIAQLWIGVCLYNLKRQTEAKAAFEKVATADISPSDKFANSEPAARAAAWLAHIAYVEKNPVELNRWADLLKTQYPDSADLRATSQLLK